MQSSVDVFVVGGGPAGLVAAIAARRQGFSVAVADGADHPIDKPCGEGLLPETQTALAHFGITIPLGEGFRFRGIRFLQGSDQVCADYPFGFGLGIRRTLLHERLVDHAESAGVQLLWKTPVVGIDGHSVQLHNGSYTARWIIGADGAASRVRRWAGLDSTARRNPRFACRRHYLVEPWSDHMEIYWGESSQAYVTPIARDQVSIVILADESRLASFSASLHQWPDLQRRVADAPLTSRERGAITSTNSLTNVFRGHIALIGDASGTVDAITGAGLHLAFTQAIALAGAMTHNDLRAYQRAHRRLSRRPTLMGDLMLLLARHGKLRRRTLRSFSAHPDLFREVLSIHAGDFTIPGALATSARVGWRFLAA